MRVKREVRVVGQQPMGSGMVLKKKSERAVWTFTMAAPTTMTLNAVDGNVFDSMDESTDAEDVDDSRRYREMANEAKAQSAEVRNTESAQVEEVTARRRFYHNQQAVERQEGSKRMVGEKVREMLRSAQEKEKEVRVRRSERVATSRNDRPASDERRGETDRGRARSSERKERRSTGGWRGAGARNDRESRYVFDWAVSRDKWFDTRSDILRLIRLGATAIQREMGREEERDEGEGSMRWRQKYERVVCLEKELGMMGEFIGRERLPKEKVSEVKERREEGEPVRTTVTDTVAYNQMEVLARVRELERNAAEAMMEKKVEVGVREAMDRKSASVSENADREEVKELLNVVKGIVMKDPSANVMEGIVMKNPSAPVLGKSTRRNQRKRKKKKMAKSAEKDGKMNEGKEEKEKQGEVTVDCVAVNGVRRVVLGDEVVVMENEDSGKHCKVKVSSDVNEGRRKLIVKKRYQVEPVSKETMWMDIRRVQGQ